MTRFLFLFFFPLLLLSSCKSRKVEPSVQPQPGQGKNIVVPPSVISIPISIAVAEVEESLNKMYSGLIYYDSSFEDNGTDNMQLRISKAGRFKLLAVNDQWLLEAPISIYIKGRYKTTVVGIPIEETKDANFNIVVKTRTALDITEGWDLRAITKGYFEWTEKPYLDLGVIRIPIASFVESTLNKQINEFAKTIDKEIEKFLDLKNNVNTIWQSLYQPVKVSDTYDAWLSVKPYSIMLNDPKTVKGIFTMRLGIRSAFDISLGEKPAAGTPTKLPSLLVHQRLDSSFTIYINNLAKYDLVNSMAKKELNGKKFDFEEGRHSITIDDIDIFGNGNSFIARIKFDGRTGKGLKKKKVTGTLFLNGTPYYDSTDMSIKVRGFNYDISTSNAILKTANWLLHGTMVKQVEKQLVFPLKEQIEQGIKSANEAFKDTPVSSIARMNGRIEKIVPWDVLLDAQGIHVVLQCKGVAEVKITGF